ncbi:amino acid adenylation domain-containing protein [Catenulispora sp. GP43]|uniref:amino acid adenylation domain-containing protein n=1 Tax=Catenulispora sp. GP43 TaxID=3156263 RepID=UPI00351979A6
MTSLLPELILSQARRTPQASAVVSAAGEVTYRELVPSALRVCASLSDLGVRRESAVALSVAQGPDMVAALLGVWLAGGYYVPLELEAPPARRRQVVEASGVQIVVIDEGAALKASGLRESAAVHSVAELTAAGEEREPRRQAASRQAAYMIFTSGSTGAPKGVVVEHEGIANRVLWGIRALRLTDRDRVLQKTPLTFDAAGWEVLAPLVYGGAVAFGRPGAGRDPGELVASIRERGATVLQVVPSMLRLLAAEPGFSECTSLRLICSAGEPLHAELCRRVLARIEVELWNTYGPTECSIDTLAGRVDPVQSTGPVPIGRPIDNARVLLMPTDQSPEFDLREMYLCGPGVGRGYQSEPALTAERFLPDPGGPPGSRMYRSGDLVRELPDGTIEFVGRADDQVKINGIRIEPGEIEAVLEAHPAVREAAVRALDGPDGARRLAAWVVTSDLTPTSELTAFLHERLPSSYVPAVISELDALPRMPNGKTDRARLPEPDFSRPMPGSEALTSEQRIVLEAWRGVLGPQEMGLDDDFFHLGGHSLQLFRLAAQLTETSGLTIEPRDLHRRPTVRDQALILRKASEAVPIAPLAPDARLPLSSTQERFWVLDRTNPRSREYLLPILIWLPASVPADLVEGAMTRLIERHEILRTGFGMDDSGLFANVRTVDQLGWSLQRVERVPEEAAGTLAELFDEGFDLSSAPLLRAVLIGHGAGEQLLAIACHHIICDGWSSRLLDEELRELIAAGQEQRPAVLPQIPVRFVEAAVDQRARLTGKRTAEQLEFWRAALPKLPALALPGRREPSGSRSADGGSVLVKIPAHCADALCALGRRRAASPNSVFLALWATALARAAGQWDFAVAVPHAGRDRPEVDRVVGPFVNTILLRPRLSSGLSFREALERVEYTAREAFARSELPFEAVMDAVARDRERPRDSLFQTLFTLIDDGAGQIPRARDLELLGQAVHTARTDLALTVWPCHDGDYGGFIEYSTDLYDRTVASALAEQLHELAERFAANPALKIGAAEPDTENGQLEASIADAMGELLENTTIGLDEDFMACGGTSLLAARLLWRVQNDHGVEVSMRVFFDAPTARDLAREVARLRTELTGSTA